MCAAEREDFRSVGEAGMVVLSKLMKMRVQNTVDTLTENTHAWSAAQYAARASISFGTSRLHRLTAHLHLHLGML